MDYDLDMIRYDRMENGPLSCWRRLGLRVMKKAFPLLENLTLMRTGWLSIAVQEGVYLSKKMQSIWFLSLSAVLHYDLGMGGVYTGIDSKRMTVGSRSFHHGFVQRLQFFDTNFHTLGATRKMTFRRLQTRLWWVKTVKKRRFFDQ